MRRRGLITTAAGATTFVLLLAVAASALASEWTGHPLSGEGAQSQIFGISCPDASLCVGVGGNNTIVSSTDPLAPGGWSTAYVAEGVAAGAPNQRQIKGVSCPSAQLCVAVSFLGRIITSTSPAGGSSAWQVADLDPSGPNTHFYGVSCPTAGFCAAVAGGGEIATSTNPTGGAGAWTITRLPEPLELRAISCESPSLCVAVGDDGTGIRPQPANAAEAISSTAPTAGLWQQAEPVGAHGSLFGVSCPSAGLCVAGDMFGNVVGTTAPTGAGSAWTSFGSGATVQITGVGCSSSHHCLIVDNNGDALTASEPLAGSRAWTLQNLIPYSTEPLVRNALFSAACPSPEFCAIGATGEVLTSTDPNAPPPQPIPVKRGGHSKHEPHKAHKRRPKRPRVILLSGSASEVPLRHRRAFLQFRFYVKRKFQVRGYVCSFDGHKAHRCRSPQRVRVGPGHHRFQVRAIGWTWHKGPPAAVHIWVCRHATVAGTCRRPPPR